MWWLYYNTIILQIYLFLTEMLIWLHPLLPDAIDPRRASQRLHAPDTWARYPFTARLASGVGGTDCTLNHSIFLLRMLALKIINSMVILDVKGINGVGVYWIYPHIRIGLTTTSIHTHTYTHMQNPQISRIHKPTLFCSFLLQNVCTARRPLTYIQWKGSK